MKTTLKNVVRTFLVASVLTVGFGLLPVSMVNAAAPVVPTTGYGLNDSKNAPLPGHDSTAIAPYETVVSVINFVLGFLGIIAVIIILIAGFKWMTAGGKDEQVESAQKMLIQGVIGLVIILSAWGIAQYAFSVPATIIK